MKIYIKNYNIKDIKKKLEPLHIYFVNEQKYIQFYSNEGIFIIENIKIFKLNILDVKLEYYKLNNVELVIDKSIVVKEICYQLPMNSINNNITTFYYQLHKKSKVKLIIEGISQTDIITDNYKNYIPTNFYFEISPEFEINNLFIKEEINEFLSLLTNI